MEKNICMNTKAFIGKNKCEEFLLSSQFYLSAKKQERVLDLNSGKIPGEDL